MNRYGYINAQNVKWMAIGVVTDAIRNVLLGKDAMSGALVKELNEISCDAASAATNAVGNFMETMGTIDGKAYELSAIPKGRLPDGIIKSKLDAFAEAAADDKDITTADLLEFLAERLVNEFGDDENSDFIAAATTRAKLLRIAVQKSTDG